MSYLTSETNINNLFVLHSVNEFHHVIAKLKRSQVIVIRLKKKTDEQMRCNLTNSWLESFQCNYLLEVSLQQTESQTQSPGYELRQQLQDSIKPITFSRKVYNILWPTVELWACSCDALTCSPSVLSSRFNIVFLLWNIYPDIL